MMKLHKQTLNKLKNLNLTLVCQLKKGYTQVCWWQMSKKGSF